MSRHFRHFQICFKSGFQAVACLITFIMQSMHKQAHLCRMAQAMLIHGCKSGGGIDVRVPCMQPSKRVSKISAGSAPCQVGWL